MFTSVQNVCHIHVKCLTFIEVERMVLELQTRIIQGRVSFKPMGASKSDLDPATAREALCRQVTHSVFFPLSLLSHLHLSLQMTDASCGQEDLESSYI